MPITATCPHCGHTVKAPDNAGGKKGKCPRCAGIVPIPDMPEILDDEEENSPYGTPFGFAQADPSPYIPPINTGPTTSYPSVPPVSRRAENPVPAGVIAMVTGKPATAWGYRSSFGRTTLSLTPRRLIEVTRKPIEERDCEIPLFNIDSAEVIAKGNPTYIGLALTTIGLASVHPILLIVPVIFAVLFFLFKHRFLVVRSQTNAMVLGVKGDDRPAREFVQILLAEVERGREEG